MSINMIAAINATARAVEVLNSDTSKLLVRKARGGGGAGVSDTDTVHVAATKALLPLLENADYFARGWVTGESGDNYGPWVWTGLSPYGAARWQPVPMVYRDEYAASNYRDLARPGDFAVGHDAREGVEVKTNDGTWISITHLEV